MKKNFLQDVIPPNHKRSIRDIPLPKRGVPKHKDVSSYEPAQPIQSAPEKISSDMPTRSAPEITHAAFQNPSYTAPVTQDKEQVFNPQQFHTTGYNNTLDSDDVYKQPLSTASIFSTKKPTGGGFLKKTLLFFFIILILAGGFLFSQSQATVVMYPKQSSHDVNVSISTVASTTIAVSTQVTQTASITVPATSEQQVEQQAMGRIKIINTHAQEPQELVKNTRFQTSQGLIYRIKESVSIPGYTASGPGTLEVDVYADSAGEEYNIGKTTFTIPGFSGMDQFTKITAESVTEMTGGYIGIKKVVSEEAQEEAQETLEAQLSAKFTDAPQINESQIIIADIQNITFGELMDVVSGDFITLTLTATAPAYAFEKQAFMDYIGQNTIVGVTASNSFTLKPEALTYTLAEDEISIAGSTHITWTTDVEAFKKAIAGKKKSEVVDIINSYDSIQKTDIILKPFWKTRFPSDVTKINVEVAG